MTRQNPKRLAAVCLIGGLATAVLLIPIGIAVRQYFQPLEGMCPSGSRPPGAPAYLSSVPFVGDYYYARAHILMHRDQWYITGRVPHPAAAKFAADIGVPLLLWSNDGTFPHSPQAGIKEWGIDPRQSQFAAVGKCSAAVGTAKNERYVWINYCTSTEKWYMLMEQ